MELDDLKAAWAELDRKLATTQAAVARLHAERTADRTKSALRLLPWQLVWELLEGVVAVVLVGMYLANNFGETRFAVPGLILHGLAILSIVSTVWQMVLLGRIDYSAPVVDIQRRLAALRAARCRAWFWVLVLAPLVWILLLIVGVKGLFGGDVYAACGLPFVLANLAFGAAVGLASWVVTKVWATKRPASAWREWLRDGLAGTSLTRAKRHLREAAEFAAE
jgi:F0F1-type ATP synthase assembly protein I